MTGNGDDGAAMSSLGKQPLVKASDVGVAMGFKAHRTVRRFDKGPFQILIHETRDTAEVGVTSAGKYPRYKSRVTGQIFSPWEAAYVADLQTDDWRENFTDAGNTA